MPSQKYYGRRETSRMSCPPRANRNFSPDRVYLKKTEEHRGGRRREPECHGDYRSHRHSHKSPDDGGFLRALAWGVTKGAITSAAYIGIQKVVDIIFDQRRR
ncbi:hypothetical protein PG995_006404 [Apiospora arundinis]